MFEGAYYYASLLLAAKPWSVFAPFEILKVTITKDGEESILFAEACLAISGQAKDNGDGDETCNSPFGPINGSNIQLEQEMWRYLGPSSEVICGLVRCCGRDALSTRTGILWIHRKTR